MEIHQLRDFVAVANTGSFSQAALKCRVSQPSLSKAIQRLEAEIGENLLIRLRRRAVLTSAGQLAFKRATRILAEFEELKRDISDPRPCSTLQTADLLVPSSLRRMPLPEVSGRRAVCFHWKASR